ncbi:hypothetical protein EJB05_29720 [Eragrostis curvula]|uniref:Uncharacterized protein n=1 Tax=Eragrostis curvula TaxID=38414 RepID=A0A5J9UV48_9POAL|nr:hypothetical protein EJB05_29720 [Eragrostis curvula]
MGRRRRSPKLAGGGSVGSRRELKPFASDPLLEDPPRPFGIGGADPSVYFAVCRRDWFYGHSSYRMFKVDVSHSEPSSSPGVPPLQKIGFLKTNVGGKTVVSMLSRWIVAVGGPSRTTVIFDTKIQKQINGPKLVSAKQDPVVVTVGYKVYALSRCPSYTEDPDFEPWFEVLDLSQAMVVERADGKLRLVGCSWVALKDPACFPCELTPTEFLMPPIIIVRSHVVVGPYILISLDQPNSGTYAFDTDTEEWHKFDNEYLPFVGSPTPHGQSGFIFLGLSQENGPIKAYRIHVSASSSQSNFAAVAGSSDKGGTLKLSITKFPLKGMAHDGAGAGAGHCFTSLDTRRSATLAYWFDNSKCNMRYDDDNCVYYPMRLHVKLATYQMEEIPEEKQLDMEPEIAISRQQERAFKISSFHGFSYPPIAFVLSI